MKKFISILLVLSMVFGMSTSVFAETEEPMNAKLNSISVTKADENTCILSDGSSTAIIRTEEIENGMKMELKGTGNDGFFIVDRKAGTMYSSFTGNTIDIKTLSEEIDTTTVSTMGTGAVLETYTQKISYKRIAELIGDTYSTYDLAFTIASIFAATQGIALTTIPAIIMGALEGQLLSTILEGVKTKAKGGVKITINLCVITKHQGGRIVEGRGYKLGSLTTYK